MKEANQSTKKQKITYTMATETLERAEQALARLGYGSRSNFAKSILMSHSTVAKFFGRKPIQLDSLKRICQQLKISDWQEIAVIKKKERLTLLEIDDCSSSKFQEDNEDNNQKAAEFSDKWNLVKEIPNHSVVSRSLRNVDLSDTDLSDTDLSRADLRGANLSNADMNHADLRGADLRNTYLNHADLRGVYLHGANLSNADLRGVYLHGANLSNTNLSNAYFNGSDLIGVDMICANLSNANLSNVNLSNAYLKSANLSNANLSNAKLNGTNLIDANLNGTNLNNTEVVNTRFGNNLGISESLKCNLTARGAIFKDSPGDRAKILTAL